MTGYVLLIDEKGLIEPVLARVFEHSLLTIVSLPSVTAAKRKLIEERAALVISVAAFASDPEGGYRLARELSGHETLSTIPLVLVSNELTEEVIRKATDVGARALIPWPVSVESLQARLKPLLGDLLALPQPETAPPLRKPETTASEPPARTSTPVGAAPPASTGEAASEKFQLAQQLLAKVLHNLKTSALLDVVDLEDVPEVVVEITRSVCGAPAGDRAAVRQPSAPPAESASATRSEGVDLDSIFRKK